MLILLKSFGIVAITYYLVWLISSSIARARNASKFGYKAPPRAPFFYGLFMYIKVRLRSQRYTILPSQAKLHTRFGHTFTSTVGVFTNIYTVHPENIQTIWSTNFPEWGVEPVRLRALGEFCGRGILTVDGTRWALTRRMIKPVFNRTDSVDMESYDKYLTQMFEQIPRGTSIDLQPLIFDMYFQSCYSFFVGEPLENLPNYGLVKISKLRQAFDDGVMGARIRDMMGALKFLFRSRDWLRACNYSRDFSDAVADHAMKLEATGAQTQSSDGAMKPLIYKFALRGDGALDDGSLRNDIIQFFMSAPHTVAGVVNNALFLLSTHPEEWEKVRGEVQQAPRSLTQETLRSMPLLRNAMMESLRLFPSTTFEARTALADTMLPCGGGDDGTWPIFVAKGTSVRANIYALHRDPKVFGDNSDAFVPDRWKVISPKWWEFIPFGGGKRVCPGRDKATTECLFALARFVQEFESLQSTEIDATKTARNGISCWVKAK